MKFRKESCANVGIILPLQAILEKMKWHKDRMSPGDEGANYKIWALCDLATGLLISKTTNYELKEYPRVR